MEIRITLDRIITLLTVLAVFLTILLGAGLFEISRQTASALAENRARVAAESAAKSIEQSVALFTNALERTVTDPDLAAALAGGDAAAVRGAEERLLRAIPGALLVRLLPANVSALDESRIPRMGYADLDMVRQALKGAPAPAMHAAGTPDAHIALARALPGGRGAVLLSLMPSLAAPPAALTPEAGAVETRQDSLRLGFAGDEQLKDQPPAAEIVIEGTPWTAAYWPPPGQPLNPLWLLGPAGLAAILIGAAGLGARFWVIAAMYQGQESIVKLVRDRLSGKAGEDYPVKTEELRLIVTKLTQLKRTSAEPAASSQPELPPPIREIAPLEKVEVKPVAKKPEPAVAVAVSPSLFRAYDIRGSVEKEFKAPVVQRLGLAIGSEIRERGEQRVIVGRDGRLSSPDLSAALVRGLQESGCSVIDLGLVPTPVVYFATQVLNTRSGVMLTGSHHAAEYNGLKVVISGETLKEREIQKLRERIEKNEFSRGAGQMEVRDIVPDYVERVVEDIQMGRDLKIVVDCGNGVAGIIAPALLKALGCDVVPLYCDVDGSFPNHYPDPSRPENLAALAAAVAREGADLGVAFDSDGDRLGVVDSAGKIIWPDRQLMLFAADVLSREPGADIIFDVKCTRHLPGHIVRHGGRPLMWKTGHSLIKSKITETGALLAGELSGHIFFSERWFGFDDALYASARLVEILSGDPRPTAEIFAELPDSPNTPELSIPIEEGEGPGIIEALKALALFPDARITDIDGLRVDFGDGFALIRPSNTSSALRARFEADNELALARIQSQFRSLLLEAKPNLDVPF